MSLPGHPRSLQDISANRLYQNQLENSLFLTVSLPKSTKNAGIIQVSIKDLSCHYGCVIFHARDSRVLDTWCNERHVAPGMKRCVSSSAKSFL